MLILAREMTMMSALLRGMSPPSTSACLAAPQGLADLHQIGGEDAPAHPAPEARFPMGQTAGQPIPAAPHAEAPLNPGSEAEPAPKPCRTFLLHTRRRGSPRIGDYHTRDSHLRRQLLVGRGVHPTL